MTKTWLVYLKQQENNIISPMVIEEGFSFKAMFLGVFWFCYYGLWAELIIYILLQFIFALVASFLGENYNIALQCGLAFLIGQFATEIRAANFKRSGYRLIDIIIAKTSEKAKLNFYKKYFV
jgi:hypothetical protein